MAELIQFPCFLKRDKDGNPIHVIIQDTSRGEILSLNVTQMSFEEIGEAILDKKEE